MQAFAPKQYRSQPSSGFEKSKSHPSAASHSSHLKPPAFLQAKLAVSSHEDLSEREADRVAEEVMGEGAVSKPTRLPIRSSDARPSRLPAAVQNAIRSPGSALGPDTRVFMQARMGEDFSGVRVHTGQEADRLARDIHAHAFTMDENIGFADGKYEPTSAAGRKLLAHELTHVVQQRRRRPVGAPAILSRKAADHSTPTAGKSAPTPEEIAPGIMDLQGMTEFEPPQAVVDFMSKRRKGKVNVRFGKLAEGPIEIAHSGKKYAIYNQHIPLTHPLFSRVADVASDLEPTLNLHTSDKGIEGYVGFAKGGELAAHLLKTPEVIGLTGFNISSMPSLINKVENGSLHLGMKGVPIKLASAFAGKFDLEAIDDAIAFSGNFSVKAGGLAKGDIDLQRSAEGLITGHAVIALQLPKNFNGNLDVTWNGVTVTGEGKVSYAGEKLSGFVLLKLMEKGEAEQLAKEKKDPPEQSAEAAAPAAAAKPKPKPKNLEYVVFGEGDLSFAFNDWLTGTAHAIVDYKGYVTLVTKITPQKEVKLFEKHYSEQIGPSLDVEAVWGLPVIANVYIGASGSLIAFADLKGVIHNIEVDGDYSTDPAKCNDFTFQGELNISAAAGLTLALRVYAGVTILSHHVQAGGELDGTVGIHGYVIAHPIIGYREKMSNGEDKKGEFFIQGEAEVAAQAFLGLGGKVFIELKTPWWSPLSDREWPWPLFNKEWPLGGSVGIGMTVEYVFGSGQWPSVKFHPVDFSAEKLMTDLIHDDVPGKSGDRAPQPSPWKEKNTQAAPVPPKTPPTTGAPPVKAPKPTVKTPSPRKGPLASNAEPHPQTRAADGKTVQQHQEEAAKREKKPAGTPAPKGAATPTAASAAAQQQKAHDEELLKGLAALEAVTERYAKDGASKDEVITGVKAVRRKFTVFKDIQVIDGDDTWDYDYYASRGKKKGPRKKRAKRGTPQNPYEITWPKRKLADYEPIWLAPASVTKGKLYSQPQLRNLQGAEEFRPTARKKLFEDDKIGVTDGWQTKRGRTFHQVPFSRQEQGGRSSFNELLKKHGYDRERGPRGETTDGDHVSELQVVGVTGDVFENLWPLNFSENRSSGSTLHNTIHDMIKELDSHLDPEKVKNQYSVKIKDFVK